MIYNREEIIHRQYKLLYETVSEIRQPDEIQKHFTEYFNTFFLPETNLPDNTTLEWFIITDNIPTKIRLGDFWEWNSEHLSGYVRCMSRTLNEEIWGFSKQSDISLFLLKWA